MEGMKKIGSVCLMILILQLTRMFLTSILLFSPVYTQLSLLIVELIVHVIWLICLIQYFNIRQYHIPFFGEQKKKNYLIGYALACLFVFITPIITQQVNIETYIDIIDGALLIPLFEEILFRGYIWDQLQKTLNAKTTCLIVTFLFGIWHLGYVDTLIRHTAFYCLDVTSHVLFMKVIIGLGLGLIMGGLRYKSENISLGLLLYMIMNTFGK